MFLKLITIISLLGCYANAILDVETTTIYINKQVEVIYNPTDGYIFTAPTCGYYDTGYDVTVEIYNPQNPTNNPDFGIAYYAVTNKQTNGTVQPGDIICSVDTGDTYTNTCNGPAGKGDLYVHVKGNRKHLINFALNVTFSRHNPMLAKTRPITRPFHFPALTGTTTFQELRQVITYGRTIELAYGNRTHIHLRMCPSSVTTSNFKVTTILQADDPDAKSLIAQAICTTSKCNFDTTAKEGYVGGNSRNLPVNEADTIYGSYNELFVYAVAYNGVLKNGYPHGMFRFGATIDPR